MIKLTLSYICTPALDNLHLLVHESLDILGVLGPNELLEVVLRHPAYLGHSHHVPRHLVHIVRVDARQPLQKLKGKVFLEVIVLLLPQKVFVDLPDGPNF